MTRLRVFLLAAMAAAPAVLGQIAITNSSPLPVGFARIPYIDSLTVVSYPSALPVSFSLTAGSILPDGLSLSANGTLSGTATQSGTFTFQVTATNEEFSDTETFSLTLLAPFITINSPPSLTPGFVGQPYSLALSASSDPTGLTWSLASGALPPGLTLSPSGSISGSPAAVGANSFTLNVQISGTPIVANQSFTLQVYTAETTIQTNSLPFAFIGAPYSATLIGGPSGATWALSGTLPQGITFNPNTGVFSGTASILGIYPLQLVANFPYYLSATANLTLYVTSGPLTVPKTNLAPAEQGWPYQTTVVGSGGLTPYQWSFSASSTQGMSIGAQTGAITGTPPNTGNFVLPILLSDATGQSSAIGLTLFVANPLSVATTLLPNGSVGSAYSQSLLQGGGVSPFTWIVLPGSGSLPPGLALSSSGVISGAPLLPGIFHFTAQVTDGAGRTAAAPLAISMAVAPLTITTSALASGELTVPYSQALAASGGVAPYTWALVAGTLPPGLGLNAGINTGINSGIISGTPLGPLGVTSFTLQVTDSSPAPALTVQKAFTINVALILSITTTGPLPGGVLKVPYSQTLAGSGGTPPYTWTVTSGALPPGLQLNASTGVISGTPTAAGANSFQVTLADAAGLTAQQQLSISVAGPPSITTGNLSATVGSAFSQTLAATGGTPPYTWSISSGTLPAGLQLSGGVISGTPTAAASANLTLKVTDSNGLTATAPITITVTLPPTPALTIGTIPGAAATQPVVTLSLASAFPVALTGTLSVSFQSAVGGSPTEVTLFTNAGSFTSLSFNIAAGATAAVFPNTPVLATGTTAGTITLTATLSAGGVNITPTPATETITIAPAAPVINSVTFSNAGGSLAVVVTGYSSTREAISGQFTFAPASGSTLSQSTVTVPVGPAFSTWYSSSGSNQWGGQFMLTVPFSVSGDAADVASVSVTLTNTKGTSVANSPQ